MTNSLSRIELEILCYGEQPISTNGDPIHNIIQLLINAIIPKKICKEALKFIHYFVNCRLYDISPENLITGVIWSVDQNNKREALGRYIKRSNRFTWEANVV
jgi:hypothetical protein